MESRKNSSESNQKIRIYVLRFWSTNEAWQVIDFDRKIRELKGLKNYAFPVAADEELSAHFSDREDGRRCSIYDSLAGRGNGRDGRGVFMRENMRGYWKECLPVDQITDMLLGYIVALWVGDDWTAADRFGAPKGNSIEKSSAVRLPMIPDFRNNRREVGVIRSKKQQS